MKKRITLTQHTYEARITASTTQTQGKCMITHDINEISTCGTTNDVITLMPCKAGLRVTVINNGAQSLQIFPASGDNLGAGVNTSTTLATGKSAIFESYNATNWVKFTN